MCRAVESLTSRPSQQQKQTAWPTSPSTYTMSWRGLGTWASASACWSARSATRECARSVDNCGNSGRRCRSNRLAICAKARPRCRGPKIAAICLRNPGRFKDHFRRKVDAFAGRAASGRAGRCRPRFGCAGRDRVSAQQHIQHRADVRGSSPSPCQRAICKGLGRILVSAIIKERPPFSAAFKLFNDW